MLRLADPVIIVSHAATYLLVCLSRTYKSSLQREVCFSSDQPSGMKSDVWILALLQRLCTAFTTQATSIVSVSQTANNVGHRPSTSSSIAKQVQPAPRRNALAQGHVSASHSVVSPQPSVSCGATARSHDGSVCAAGALMPLLARGRGAPGFIVNGLCSQRSSLGHSCERLVISP